MNKGAIILVLIYLLSLSLCASCNARSDNSVYICTGCGAYCYHSKRTCRGLNNCQATIREVPLNVAKSKHRKPCDICY